MTPLTPQIPHLQHQHSRDISHSASSHITSILDVIRMPRTLHLMCTIIAVQNLLVIGQTIPAKTVLTPRTCATLASANVSYQNDDVHANIRRAQLAAPDITPRPSSLRVPSHLCTPVQRMLWLRVHSALQPQQNWYRHLIPVGEKRSLISAGG